MRTRRRKKWGWGRSSSSREICKNGKEERRLVRTKRRNRRDSVQVVMMLGGVTRSERKVRTERRKRRDRVEVAMMLGGV